MLEVFSVTEEGGADKPVDLTMTSLMTGMQVLADKYPHIFADVMNENDDANTADVYVQCCLFGEEVYA